MKLTKHLAGAAVLAWAAMSAVSPAKAADIVVTHYGSLMYGAPYAIAMEKGYFTEAGADVTGILTSKGGGTSVRNMMAGDTPFAEVALPAAISAIKEGFPIRIVSMSTAGSSALLVTRPGEKLENAEDLKGKRLVYSRPKSVSEAIFLGIVEAAGLKPEDVKMVAIGDFGAGLTALEHNEIDVAIIPEPIYSRKKAAGADYQVLPWLSALTPYSAGTVGIVTEEMLAAQPDQIRAIIAGRAKAVRFMYDQPEEAAAIIARVYDMEPAIISAAISNIRAMTDHWWGAGDIDYKAMDGMANMMASVGLVDLPIDWTAYVDESVLDAKATQ
ncbi:NitT/TauT family transport system substrate-binding protein [Albimonas donghaensis]|uniref:NitT/TauT family transport system substrate-binding protein n=1 Tax=Albimonas donghaensis TaxID=356660 RepID=A0A1H3DRF8_9RHOB|nr:ABC transporter substrate-binding protein [Albimonas donghaensis]SDX68927.1 NitT/TauT family transport system substrate-binding protein [Albimonas donghaensis]